jgi:hypothetical protein
MNIKRIAKFAAVIVAMFALLVVVPAYAPGPQFPPIPKPPYGKAYPAQINATGTLTLKSFVSGSLDVTINTTFASVVPDIIPPGEYTNVGFQGFATNSSKNLRLDGLLIVNGINFWVSFAVDKPQGLSDKMYSASGQLDISITEITLTPEKITEAMMKANITQFGGSDAFGFLEAHAKIGSRNITDVHGSFTLQPPPTAGGDDGEGRGNFTVSYYVVNLANATNVELNFDGSALYVEGFWNVYNRTVTVTRIDHEEETTVVNIKTLLENVTGEFNVTLTSDTASAPVSLRRTTLGNFTLDIPALKGVIMGNVLFYQTRFADPGDRDIPTCDFNMDHVVNILDINQLAKAFGAKLGTAKYDPELDVNSDFAINIFDLAAAGHQFGQDY